MSNLFDGVAYVTALLVTSFRNRYVTTHEIANAFGEGAGFTVDYLHSRGVYPVVHQICRLRMESPSMTVDYVKANYEGNRFEIFDVVLPPRQCVQFKFQNGALKRRSGRFVEIDGDEIDENEKISAVRFRRACLEFLRMHEKHAWVLFA